MEECKYQFEIPDMGMHCGAYYHSERPDGLCWMNFPKCSEEKCPLKHPELLEGAILKDKGDKINGN